MDCKQTSKLLNAYADHELSKSDQTLVESHLAECPDCRAELEDVRRLDATMRCETPAPESLRSAIADRLEAARNSRRSRVSLKEMLGMKFRIGLATLGAIALIAILMTGGHVNAQAALMKMRRAVTQVTSSHLHIELAKDIDMGDVSSDDKSDASDAKDGNSLDMLAMGLGAGIAQGNRSIDVWSQGNKWKADVFGKFDALYADGFVTLMMGDKVFMKVKAEDKDIPTNLSDQLFKEFSKATMEMKQKCNVRDIGDSIENGRNLHQLEVTGLAD